MPFFEKFKGSQPVKKEGLVPTTEVVLVPEFTTNSDLDALASKVEKLSRYKVARFMDGTQIADDEFESLKSEVDYLMQEKGDVLNNYLEPYLKLVLDLKTKGETKPFPMSDVESIRFHAAQSLLIERGQL